MKPGRDQNDQRKRRDNELLGEFLDTLIERIADRVHAKIQATMQPAGSGPRLLNVEETATLASQLHVTGATVGKWRERFVTGRLEGLLDEPRPGAPRSITDTKVEEVVTQTLETMPTNSTHWSTRLMAHKVGLSQTAIGRIWRALGCSPIVVKTSSFPGIRSLSRRCAISSAST